MDLNMILSVNPYICLIHNIIKPFNFESTLKSQIISENATDSQI